MHQCIQSVQIYLGLQRNQVTEVLILSVFSLSGCQVSMIAVSYKWSDNFLC